jgi:DNA-directed RNA polymerase subunit RPC12/RpoP
MIEGQMTADAPSSDTLSASVTAPPGPEPASERDGPAPRSREIRCAECGYDLTGTLAAEHVQAGAEGDAGAEPPARCPECGHTVDDTDSRRTREQAFFRRFGRWVALGTVLTLAAIVMLIMSLGERAALFAIPLVLLLICWVPYVLVARFTRDIE